MLSNDRRGQKTYRGRDCVSSSIESLKALYTLDLLPQDHYMPEVQTLSVVTLM